MMDPKVIAESFVTEIHAAAGERLRAALLFGSVARGEWIEDFSDINVLVLLDKLDAALLSTAAPAARHAVENGVMPLLVEQEEWRRASDVFAIEVADMQQFGIPLFGDNPADSAVIEPGALRLQAERELRAKLLHLHGGMLLAAGEPERLGMLFLRALPSFTTYMRTVLRLAGRGVPSGSQSVIQEACAMVGADPSPFIAVLDARTSREAFAMDLDTGSLADSFNTAASSFATYTDTFKE
jgi:predicted nucleotidyltransferase